MRKFILLDANVVVAYYLPRATNSSKTSKLSREIIESVRSKATDNFFYIPNFCVAEVFSAFYKHAYSRWNLHVKKHGPIDKRVLNTVRNQFRNDIHNASLFYHYELSRYHVITVDLISPINHYYKMGRKAKGKKHSSPASTFDQLIISMGMHLVKIHGLDNVAIMTTDDRIEKIVNKCKTVIGSKVHKKLKLDEPSKFIGIPFTPDSFPKIINLKNVSVEELKSFFGMWPLPERKYAVPKFLKSKSKHLNHAS